MREKSRKEKPRQKENKEICLLQTYPKRMAKRISPNRKKNDKRRNIRASRRKKG